MNLYAYSSFNDGHVHSKYALSRKGTDVDVYVFGHNNFVSLVLQPSDGDENIALLDEELVDALIVALRKAKAFLRERREEPR